jgi:hypothetical protein
VTSEQELTAVLSFFAERLLVSTGGRA